MKKHHLVSMVDRLKEDIRIFSIELDQHISTCKVEYRGNLSVPGIAVIAPPYCWRRNDPKDQLLEMNLLKNFRNWWEVYALLFMDAGDSLAREIENIRQSWETWVQRTHGWDIPANIDDARESLGLVSERTQNILDTLVINGTQSKVFIVDTNSLLMCPNIISYRQCIEDKEFDIVIPSTVLGELDELKIFGRNPNVQNKAKKAITILKGYRNQGDLVRGLVLDGTIRLKTLSAEPDFNKTLKILDRSNKDDRIIAMALQVQRENPTNTVVLITADINLQTKCAAIGIPFLEPPDNIESEI